MIPGIVASQAESIAAGGGYTAYGVKFDETDYDSNSLIINSQSVTDSPFLTASFWVNVHYNTDTAFRLISLDAWDSFIRIGMFNSQDIGVYLADSTNAKWQQFGSAGSVMTGDAWHHVYVAADNNHASGARVFNLLVDAADVVNAGSTNSAGAAFSVGLNGTKFGIPFDSDGLGYDDPIIEYADVWISVGEYLDPATYLSKFVSGGNPVDLGANGETPTGTSPTYFFSGNASDFPTNKGTGSAATVSGSIVNADTNP